MMHETPIVEVTHVYKKFCTNLRRNLLYGLQDIFRLKASKSLPPLRKEEFWALKDINFTLDRGEVVGILGMNGAGKTTLIRTLMGAIPVTHGSIEVNGRITTVFERTRAFQRFYSGRENVEVKCALFGMTPTQIKEKVPEILAFAEMERFSEAPFGSYSAGMRARLNFATSIMAQPDLLIIDEGLAVSDIYFRKKCMDAIAERKNEMGVLLVSHNLDQFEELATRLLVMDHGQVMMDTPQVKEGIEFFQSVKKRRL
jgi:lipopolysaccharide transport system ATP-binding protein